LHFSSMCKLLADAANTRETDMKPSISTKHA